MSLHCWVLSRLKLGENAKAEVGQKSHDFFSERMKMKGYPENKEHIRLSLTNSQVLEGPKNHAESYKDFI